MTHTSSICYRLESGEVAILLATYNGRKYLTECLESILSQSFDRWRCFIHDDGSKDGTTDLVKKYSILYPDKFVIVEGPPTGGAKNNFMFLLSCVEADYTMFCDQDDVWLPNKIESTYDALFKVGDCKEPVVVYTDLMLVDSELNQIMGYYAFTGKEPGKNSLSQLLKSNVTVGCTMMINRELRRRTLKLFNVDNIFMHDWWMSLIAAADGQLVFLDQQTILYRQHEKNTVGAVKQKSFLEKIWQYKELRRMIRMKRSYVQRPRLFCRELLNAVSIDCEQRQFIQDYAEISKKSKIQRIQFYLQWDLFNEKSNLLWQMFWL